MKQNGGDGTRLRDLDDTSLCKIKVRKHQFEMRLIFLQTFSKYLQVTLTSRIFFEHPEVLFRFYRVEALNLKIWISRHVFDLKK